MPLLRSAVGMFHVLSLVLQLLLSSPSSSVLAITTWISTREYFSGRGASSSSSSGWTGRLILPPHPIEFPDRALPSGQVYFQVYSTPPPSSSQSFSNIISPGDIIRLAIDPRNSWAHDFLTRTTVDIIDPSRAPASVMADATRKGVHLPRRIWNWPRPGPLEVLAGQRTYREPMGHTYESGIGEMDSIEVLLQGSWEIVLEDEITLLIVEEPTLIIGQDVALVQFIRPLNNLTQSTTGSASVTPHLHGDRGPSFEYGDRPYYFNGSTHSDNQHQQPQSHRSNSSTSSSSLSRIGYIVRHFDKKRRVFDESTDEVIYFEKAMLSSKYSAASFLDIESSPCGTMGWFIFGERITSPSSSLSTTTCSVSTDDKNITAAVPCRLIRAMEPRLATSLEIHPTKGTVRGMPWREQQEYFEEKTWARVREEKGMCITLDFENELWMGGFWRIGEQFFMVADYGASNGLGGGHNNMFLPGLGKWERVAQVNHGHLAFGEARVVMDPLTDRLKLDIQYWQINPHGEIGVISGIFKFSTYMGDVNNRGLGFILPHKAAIIKYPALSHTYRVRVKEPSRKEALNMAKTAASRNCTISSSSCLPSFRGAVHAPPSASAAAACSDSPQPPFPFPPPPAPGTILSFQPLSIMRHELAIMMTRNRNGDSTGVSSVIPYRSCIIDSTLAVLIALLRVKEIVKHGKWLAHGIMIPVTLLEEDRESYNKFHAWRKMFEEKVVGPASSMRGDWRLVELKRLPPPPECNTRYDRWVFGVHSIARAILSLRHLVPRWGFDHVVKSFLKLGASMRELKVNMMGGRQDHLIPAEAFLDRKARRREIEAK